MKRGLTASTSSVRQGSAQAGSLRAGFTLIELLVVIAIIAILAAILFPVFERARQKAIHATCLSNLKELGLASHMYFQDYDEYMLFNVYRYPAAGGGYINGPKGYSYWRWYELLYPYTKNWEILRCANYKFRPGKDGNSYGWNGYGLGGSSGTRRNTRYYTGTKLGELADPSMTIMIGPRYCGARDSCARAMAYYVCLPQAHNDGDNFCFCDGHAKWMNFGSRAAGEDYIFYYTYWYVPAR